ncbi:MAG TPA: DMT family transporter [Gallionellaceae bacterium]|nr:DMT family transporter [Gallionellaceae bacterium]
MASKQNVVAVASLLNAAVVWGLIWYPFRSLAQEGLAGEPATFAAYFIALLMGLLVVGRVWRELRRGWGWGVALILSSGWTNLSYVLAMLGGEVMRVLLLFYLAPLWTVLLSRFFLGERLNRYGYVVVALSLAGAFVMLHHTGEGFPLPENTAEWLGLSSGFAFALTNVLTRRIRHLSVAFKAAAVWFGTATLTLAGMLYHGGLVMHVGAISPPAWGLLLALGLVLCATSISVQYGLTHLPANQAIVVFMMELVVAAVSSYFLAGESMEAHEVAGAALIVVASLFSGRLEHELDNFQPGTKTP